MSRLSSIYLKVKDKQFYFKSKEVFIQNDDTILLKINKQSFKYLEVPFNEISKVREADVIPLSGREMPRGHNFLYEVININKPVKFCLELDLLSSYNDIIIIVNEFKIFLKIKYDLEIEKVKYRIHVETNKTFSYDKTDKIFHKSRVIFNVYVDNLTIQRKIINGFKRFKKYDFIDTKNNLIRCLFNKEDALNEVYLPIEINHNNRVIPIQNVNYEVANIENQVLPADFITYITNKDIHLNIEEEKQKSISKFDNIEYKINEIKKLENYIKKIPEEDYLNHNWKYNIKLIINVLLNYGIKKENIKAHQIIINFLEKSKVGNYLNSYNDNLNYIDNYIKNDLNYYNKTSFFQRLDDDIIEWIYQKLNSDISNKMILESKMISNKTYLIVYINGIQKALFDTKLLILCVGFRLQKTKEIPRSGKIKTKTVIQCKEEYNYYLETIKTDEIKSDIFKIININSLDEIPINPEGNSYVVAPTGSGKSYKVLQKDIKEILKYPDNKILIISDTRTMINKTYQDLINLLELDETDDLIYNYLMKKERKITANTRILLTSYDSLLKFKSYKSTHIIIDEFVNVSSRFEGVDKSNEKKTELLEHFFALFTTKIIKLYDANYEQNVMNIFHHYNQIKMRVYNLVGFKKKINTAIFTNNNIAELECLNLLKNDKKIVICSSSKQYTETLQAKLNVSGKIGVVIDNKGATINTRTDQTEEEKIELKDILIKNTDNWKNYDYVIYTPTITTGISFNDENYFYKSFCFICPLSSNSIQLSQMNMRVRSNISKELSISIIGNQVKTIKNVDITDTNLKNETNFNNLMSNEEGFYNVSKISKFNIEGIELSKDILNLQNYYLNVKDQRLIYDTFKTLKNWGIENIISNYYDKLPDENIDNIKEEEKKKELTNQENTYSIRHLNELDFLNATYIENYVYDKDKTYLNYDEEKTLLYKKMKISFSLWDFNVGDVDDTIIYLKMNTQRNIRLYNKSCNIRFYEVKHIIYLLFQNISKNSYNYLLKITNRTEDINQFIKWVFGLYTSFKLFDIMKLDIGKIEGLYRGKKLFFDKRENKKEFTELINEVLPYFYYIVSLKGDDNKTHNTYNEKLKWVLYYSLKEIGLTFELGKREIDPSTIKTIDDLQIYKFQQVRLENDDVNYWMNNKDKLIHKSQTIYIKNCPKIPLYTSSNYHNIFCNTDGDLLNYYNSSFCSENIEIIEAINYFEEHIIYLKEYNYNISEVVEELMKTKEEVKAELKDVKKLMNKEKKNDKVICSCGGSYSIKNKAVHYKTKQHLDLKIII